MSFDLGCRTKIINIIVVYIVFYMFLTLVLNIATTIFLH